MTEWNELSPLAKLLKSRKFLLLLLDTVVSIALWVAASYVPGAEEAVKFLIGALQPVFVALIIAISVEDAAYLKTQ